MIKKKHLKTGIQLALSITLLTLLFMRIDQEAFLRSFVEMNFPFYAAGVLAFLFTFSIFLTWRWYLIVRAAGSRISFLRLSAINLIGLFFSNFLPTAAGGDLARIYEITREGTSQVETVSTVLLDRLIGLISLVGMALLAMIIGFRLMSEPLVIGIVLAMAAVMTVSWFFFFNRGLMRRLTWLFKLPLVSRLEDLLRRLYNSLYDLQRNPTLLLRSVAVSLLAQTVQVFSIILIARALSIAIPLHYFFIFIPISWLIAMIPISLNGVGLNEGSYALFFGQVGVSSEQAIALSLLVTSSKLIASVLGGFLFLGTSARRPPGEPLTPSSD